MLVLWWSGLRYIDIEISKLSSLLGVGVGVALAINQSDNVSAPARRKLPSVTATGTGVGHGGQGRTGGDGKWGRSSLLILSDMLLLTSNNGSREPSGRILASYDFPFATEVKQRMACGLKKSFEIMDRGSSLDLGMFKGGSSFV